MTTVANYLLRFVLGLIEPQKAPEGLRELR